MTKRLRILHLSDLHIGKERPEDGWRVERVMGEAWNRNLADIRQDGPIDLICFTGDLAQKGHAHEYARLTAVIANLLALTGCPIERFFCVPGNHDIDRSIGKDVWKKIRTGISNSAPTFSHWFAEPLPDEAQTPAGNRKKRRSRAPEGYKDVMRDKLIERQQAYRTWLAEIGLAHLDPAQSPHGRLGYRHTLDLGLSAPLHIIGFDSAWLAGDDNDARKLLLTEDQVGRLMTDGNLPLQGWSIGLIHHPLDELADGDHAKQWLADYRLGLLLHGHQHKGKIETWADPQRKLPIFAAGCLYESQNYPNGLSLVEIELREHQPLRPLRIQTRAWSANGHWHNHDGLYRDSRNGWLVLEPEPVAPFTPTPGKFVGRTVELDQLRAALLPAARGEDTPPTVICCAIDGMPGVGKTRLAEEFVGDDWREALGLPKGTSQQDFCARLALGPDDPRSAEDLAAAVLAGYQRNVPVDQAITALREVLLSGPGGRRLLLIENVDGPMQAEAVASLVAPLSGCAVLATARCRDLAGASWERVPVDPLPPGKAVELLRNRIALGRKPHPLNDDEAAELAKRLGYLPLALHIAGSHLGRGVSPKRFREQLETHRLAMGPAAAGDAARNSNAARSVIASAFAISWDLWCKGVGADPGLQTALVALAHAPAEGVGDALGAVIAACDPADYEACTLEADSLSLLDIDFSEQGGVALRRVRLHPLIAEFLRHQRGPDEAAVMARIGEWCAPFLQELDSQAMPAAWAALRNETPALLHWLARAPQPPSTAAVGLGTAGYAMSNGPYADWLRACVRWSEGCKDANLHGTLRLAESRLSMRTGDPVRSEIAARAALVAFQDADIERNAAIAHSQIADILQSRGDLEEALRIRREEQMPVYERLGDVRSRAITQGKIADILESRGDLEEALRIWREEALPVYERLGDVRSRAVTHGKIADILQSRGDLEEALRIRREEQMPVYERLGDVRERAITQGRIADILQLRGELEEALRIRRQEQMPVYERLGDVRESAITQGKIADILQSLGDQEEALRIRREEELPVYERLGDVRELLVGRANLAITLVQRGRPEDRPEILTLLQQALADAERLRLPEAETIRGLIAQIFADGDDGVQP